MPDGSQPIAILCVGHVKEFYPRPMLETTGWDRRRALNEIVYEDRWGGADDNSLPCNKENS
jgi:5,6-dimethylbenzimidazole synthase